MGGLRVFAIIGAAVVAVTSTLRGASEYPAAAVMYASFGPTNAHVFIADGNGRNIKPLLSRPGFDYNPSLSADGRWVTFTSERSGSPDIYRVHPDGTGLERLTDDPAYDDRGVLSPDGQQLAFVSTRGQGNANIWVLDLPSHHLTNLTAGSPGDYRPAWSPDGQQIAFSSIRHATVLAGTDPAVDPKSYTSDIYLMRRDGSGVRRLTRSGIMFSPSWSADGTRLICAERPVTSTARAPDRPGHIVSIALVDEQVTLVRDVNTPPPLAALHMPHVVDFPQRMGRSGLAYLIEYGMSGFSDGEIVFGDDRTTPSGEFGSPHWSADGRVLVFHRLTHGTSTGLEVPSSPLPPALDALVASSFAVFGARSAFRARPGLDPHFRVMLTGSFPSARRGKRGEIVMIDPSGSRPSIVAVSADGTRRRVIFRDEGRAPQSPVVSPSGDAVAFGLGGTSGSTGQPGTSHLALIHTDGQGMRELPEAGDHAGFPSWSPDGRSLVYAVTPSLRSADDSGLRIVDVQSQTVRPLTTGPDSFPSWSPVDGRVVFTRSPRGIAGASQIYAIRADGSGLTRLTLSPGAEDAHPAWSPDGRWIAFASSRLHPRDEQLIYAAHHAAGGQIFVMRADGNDVRQLTDTPAPKGLPAWLPR